MLITATEFIMYSHFTGTGRIASNVITGLILMHLIITKIHQLYKALSE